MDKCVRKVRVLDGGFVLVILPPVVYLLVMLTELSVVSVYTLVLTPDTIKSIISFFMTKSGVCVHRRKTYILFRA